MCNTWSDGIFPGCKIYHWSLKERRSSVSFKVYHKITECLRLKGTSGGPTLLQGHQEPVAHPTVSRKFFGVSKERDSTTLNKFCLCSVICRVKVSWCLEGTSSLSLCVHFLLSWHWAALNKAWFLPLHTLSSGVCVHL